MATATAIQYLGEIKFRNAAKKVVPLLNKSQFTGRGIWISNMYDANMNIVHSWAANNGKCLQPMWYEFDHNLTSIHIARLVQAGFECKTHHRMDYILKTQKEVIVFRKAA